MNTAKLISVITVSFILTGCMTVSSNAAPKPETEKETKSPIVNRSEIEDIFKNYDQENAPGCATAVYQNGETTFSKGYGIANLDYNIPISDSTSFYMASISKQMTAAAAGLLVIRGELDVEATVSTYIDEWPEWASEVKVKHLFNHTSGLPDIYGLMSIYGISTSNVMDLDDYMEVVKMGEELMFKPGSEYAYSNSGYTTLAHLVENITQDKFSQFVDEELLTPLGMNSTHFHDDRHRVIPNRAMSYQKNGDNFRQTYLGNFQGVGPGGLYSTLKDWQRWESFWNGTLQWNGGITAEEAIELKQMMVTPSMAGGKKLTYGMGVHMDTVKGALMNGHGGSFMGFNTDYRRYPEYGVSMVTLCNRADANPQELNQQLADLFLKEYFEAYLSPFEGTYRSEELLTEFTLTIEGSNLKLNRRLSPNGYVTENGDGEWSAGSLDMEFKRNGTGEVIGLYISASRVRDIEFHRISE
ncbi:MAG: serine hydrolase domain-containing protein [Balneolales bacterium]